MSNGGAFVGNLRFVYGIIIVSLVFVFTVPAMSEANELDALNAELSEKEAEIVGVLEDIRQVHFELSELNVVVEANDEMIEALNAEIDIYKAEIEELELSIAALQESIRQRDEILKTRLSTYQANGGNATFIEVIFSATTFADFISRFTAVTQITSADADLIQQQLNDKAKVEESQIVLKDKLAEQRQLRKEYVDSNRVVLQQRQELVGLESSLLEKEDVLARERDLLQGESAAMIAAFEAAVRDEIDVFESENTESVIAVDSSNSSVSSETEQSGETTENSTNASRNNDGNDHGASHVNENNNEAAENDRVTNNSGSNNNVSSKPKEENKQKEETKPKPQEESKPKPKPKPQEETKPKEEKPTTQVGTSVITIAHQQLGVRYVYGDMKPGVSFDCSGYVSWVFQQAGTIPNIRYTTGGFASMGTKVSMENAQPGDLVFFKTTGAANSHVGIYLGNNQFIGAQTSTGVAIASMNNSYWKKAFDDNGKHVRRIN